MLQSTKQIFQILNPRDIKSLSFLLFFSLITSFLELINLGFVYVFIKTIFDQELLRDLVSNYFIFLNHLSYKTLIFLMTFIFISFFLLKSFIIIVLVYFNNKIVYKFYSNFSFNLYSHFLLNNHFYTIKKEKSKIQNSILHETQNLTKLILFEISKYIEILNIFLIVIFLFFLNTKIFLCLFAFYSLFIFVIYNSYKFKLKSFGKIRLNSIENLSLYVSDSLSFIDEISIYKKHNLFFSIFKNKINQLSNSLMKQNIYLSIPRYLFEILFIISIGIIIFIAFSLNLPVGEIAAIFGVYAASAFKILPSVNKLINVFQNINLLLPILDRLLVIKNKFVKFKSKINRTNNLKTLNIENLTFRFGKKDIFKNLSFSSNRGDCIALKGPSGSGKTTILKIIAGIYTKYEGQIFFNNYNGKNIDTFKIAYVSQDNFIFNETLLFNISLSHNVKNSKEISKILKFFNINLELNYILSENGSNLSEGQRQRICLIRALNYKPDLLLMDEPSSALDEKIKIKIFKYIKNNFKRKIIIFSTHDKDLLSMSNKIINLASK